MKTRYTVIDNKTKIKYTYAKWQWVVDMPRLGLKIRNFKINIK